MKLPGVCTVCRRSIWWSGKFAGEIQAAIGWSDEKVAGPDTNETIGGSISWLHTSGFNVTFAYTESNVGQPAA